LARRLQRSFAVLATGRRGAVAHHQTLRATIDWSYQLLAEPEQRLLARLSVFVGGCTLEAVEAVCSGEGIDPDTAFELLASLVARSLVVAEEHGLESRYRLLETIRQYGGERLDEAGETERWRARHASYYAGVLSRIREHAHDPKTEVFWAVRLGAEQDNLRAAWAWTIDTGNVDTAFSILASFAPSEIWNSYLLLLDGEAALKLPGATEHAGYPLALAVSAMFASDRSVGKAADELCRRAAEANARQASPDWRVEEVIWGARSNIAFTAGAFADAARLAEQAAAIARTGGDLADASVQLTSAAGDRLLVGDARGAVPLAREALALARHIGAPALIATGLLAVGATVAETDPDRARACLRESLELSTALDYQSWVDHIWAAAIAFLVNDRTATLELGRRHSPPPVGRSSAARLRPPRHRGRACRHPAGGRRDHPGRRRSPYGRVAEFRSADQLDPYGSSGRGTRARTPRPRCRHGLGPSRLLHPRSEHPSPQRTPIQAPAMSEFTPVDARQEPTRCASLFPT
jgi:hypothetical protein